MMPRSNFCKNTLLLRDAQKQKLEQVPHPRKKSKRRRYVTQYVTNRMSRFYNFLKLFELVFIFCQNMSRAYYRCSSPSSKRVRKEKKAVKALAGEWIVINEALQRRFIYIVKNVLLPNVIYCILDIKESDVHSYTRSPLFAASRNNKCGQQGQFSIAHTSPAFACITIRSLPVRVMSSL